MKIVNPKVSTYEKRIIFVVTFRKRIRQIEIIISHNPQSKEYKVCFTDGTVDYITILDDNNPAVKSYMARKGINVELFDARSGSWMKPIWENEE